MSVPSYERKQSKVEFLSKANLLKYASFEMFFLCFVTITNSITGHSVDDDNCWDVSEKQDESLLAWYSEEVIDDVDLIVTMAVSDSSMK